MKHVVYPSVIFLFFIFFKSPLQAQVLVNQVAVDTLANQIPVYNYETATYDSTTGLYVGVDINQGPFGNKAAVVAYDVHGNRRWRTFLTNNTLPLSYITSVRYRAGYVYTSGLVIDTATGFSSLLTCKLDASTGDTIFSRVYHGSYAGSDVGGSLLVDDTGNIYVCGTVQTGVTEYSMALLKYSSSGNLLFNTSYDSSGLYSGAVGMVLNPGSNIAMTGYSGTAYSQFDFCTVWVSLGGNVLSVSRSPSGARLAGQPLGIIRDQAQNIVILGTASTGGGHTVIKLIEYDSTFTQLAVKTYGDSSSVTTASALTYDDAGHLIICGTSANPAGGKDMLVLALNSTSYFSFSLDTLLWSKRLSAPSPVYESSAAAITTDNNGNTIVVGRVFNGSKFVMNTVCLATNNGGALTWAKTYDGGGSYDGATGVVAADNSDIYTLGTSINADTLFKLIDYATLPITTTIATDTAGNPLYVQGNLIIRFSPAVLNLDVVNNKGIIFGTPEQILTSGFVATFESLLGNLGVNGKNCYLQKLAPDYHTWDKTLISTIGDTVKIPPFWASFLLIYPASGNEMQVRDSLATLYPNVLSEHLNSLGVTSSCNCGTICADDSLYTKQYGLHADSVGNYSNGNVNAEGAWVIETGKPFVKIGIFDTGIRWGHPDFLTGLGDSTKVGGGYDFTVHAGTPLLSIPSDEADFYGHGTQLAGIIGALRNNNVGIAGIAGGNYCNSPTYSNTGASVYGFDVDIPGGGPQSGALVSTAATIMAMNYALYTDDTTGHENIDILNFSSNIYNSDPNFQELKEKYYYAFRLGKTVVGSRGDLDDNIHFNSPSFPASFPDDWVICVGGSDTGGDLAENIHLNTGFVGSQYGYPVDIVAPFINIMNPTTDLYNAGPNSSYTNTKSIGTSFSVPYASGFAALLLSHLNNPSGSPDPNNLVIEDVEHIMQQKAYLDPLLYTSPPYDINVGWGRLDMGASMQMADTSHAHILHFNSITTSTSTSITKISGADIGLTLTDPFPVDSLPILPAKGYLAEVYMLTDVVHHSIVQYPGTAVIAGWARSSSSNCYALYDTSDYIGYVLDPYEKAYMDSSVVPGPNSATIWGYFYLMKDSLNPTDSSSWVWIPQNPFDTLHPPKMSYTLYIDTVSSGVILGEQNLKWKSDILFAVYPNPATNNLHISLNLDKADDYTISIITPLGQPAKQLFTGKTAGLSADYNISSLEGGLYFVQALSANSRRIVKLSIIK